MGKRRLKSLCFPIYFILKKGWDLKDVTDCRAINYIITKYGHHILRFDDLLDELFGACLFSKIDLKNGFH